MVIMGFVSFKKQLVAILAIVLLFPYGLQAQFGFRDESEQKVAGEVSKIGQTLYNIDKYYLDTINFPNMTEEIVKMIIEKLDPHSAYISAKDVAAMNEPLVGNFNGIGVEFALINDTLTIQATVPGGPSEKVGIKAGDKIIAVDGETISGTNLTIERVHGYLRGPKGSKVAVSILRKGEGELLDFVITRDKIPLNSVDASYELEPGYIYVKLSRFAATSYQEIMKAILAIDGPRKGIVLDLRGNGGGYLVAALQIANEFLGKGELLLYTEGRKVQRMSEYANGRGLLQNTPVVVLIDENSASASEIVSGALQDWDRGIIIGRRSFGKGLVQQQFNLLDGSQLRLTIARYHTPSGRVIQSPYEQGKAEDYYKAFYERYAKGETFSRDSIQLPDSLKYRTLRLGRTVYGGGGIMPDIFIPADTSHYTPFYGEIVRKGLITDFINSYVDNNRPQLARKYKSAEDFEKSFVVTDKFFNEFLAYCKEKGVEPKENEIEISGPELKKYLKGFVLRNLFDFNSYLRYLNRDDREILKALEVLKEPAAI
ncbi:MAG: PDZ domain-containing protein [Bacteroidales bacterium]|nr:PDZ domain-containing protein [Bacteroidales bacterium]